MSREPTSNLSEYTVTELSGSIKRTVEGAFSHVRVRGEISGFRGPHSSGHAYFSIKDERARMDAVVWKGVYNRLKFKPEEGMEMIATGKVTTYPGSSKYQIVIEQLEPAGAGALMALLEERKKKLATEGLFEEARKQLLPYMPKVIGVVTSPTGAVIRDILHRISDRFPVQVIIWPVRVQGDTSGDEVARAIDGFNALDANSQINKPELIIVARGGGSLEDLWGFNDEAVVRAAANSDIPLISAVGHETDWTLLDLVADKRAPTPTGAAEMAVPVKAELDATIANLNARLSSASTRVIDQRRQNFQALSRGIPSLDNLLALPRRRIDEASNLLGKAVNLNVMNKRRALETPSARLTPISLQASLQDRTARLMQNTRALKVNWDRIKEQKITQIARMNQALSPVPQQIIQRISQSRSQIEQSRLRADGAINRQIVNGRQQLSAQNRVLQSLAYKNVLNRGFAIIRDMNKKPVTLAEAVTAQQHLSIEFSDSMINVVETGNAPEPEIKAPVKHKKPTKPKDAAKDQGSLF
ncbi:exodeoxyribonuclease VII large subunit [Lentilitoribacter sp. EG35]|uniref:exodeoxyribonuclease VII large subunit n=1 Tax=Lentilitoribacter sp. EG35 TaxID=3234192 RepID=UPI0034607285